EVDRIGVGVAARLAGPYPIQEIAVAGAAERGRHANGAAGGRVEQETVQVRGGDDGDVRGVGALRAGDVLGLELFAAHVRNGAFENLRRHVVRAALARERRVARHPDVPVTSRLVLDEDARALADGRGERRARVDGFARYGACPR